MNRRQARVDRPASVRRGPDGQLYAAGFGRGDVVRYEPVELEFRGDHLFVLGNDTKNLVEIDPSGAVVRSFGDPTTRGAQDFVVDGDVAYVAVESHPELGTAIQIWDLATGTLVRDFGHYDELAFAAGLALHDGILYVSDFERGRVTRFDPVTGESLGVLVEGLTAPVDVDIGPDGALADGVLERPLGFTFIQW